MPAVLLCAVASWHHYRITVSDQSWWGAGAGFGMFTKLDYHATRILRIKLYAGERVVPVDVNMDSSWLVRVLPSQQRVERLARELLASHWTVSGQSKGPSLRLAGADDSATVKIDRVEVSLLRTAFNPRSGQVRLTPIGFALAE